MKCGSLKVRCEKQQSYPSAEPTEQKEIKPRDKKDIRNSV